MPRSISTISDIDNYIRKRVRNAGAIEPSLRVFQQDGFRFRRLHDETETLAVW
jgi:hypothetical protein